MNNLRYHRPWEIGLDGKEDGKIMDKLFFYKLYLPALEKAFEFEDDDPLWVKGPEYYIEDKFLKEVGIYVDTNTDDDFLNSIGYYFDAKAHDFPSIGRMDIYDYKRKIILTMEKLKVDYDI